MLGCYREMEAENEKVMLRAQHGPKDLQLDAFSTVHDSGEYFGEINERIDVLMAVRVLSRVGHCE